MGSKYEYCARGIAFGTFAIILEITFFVLYCVLVDYGTYYVPPWLYPFINQTNFTNSTCCSPLCNLEQGTGIILLGLGFLFSVLKCTSFSAVGFVLFLLAIVIQWAGLVIPWLFQAALKLENPQDIHMNVPILCDVIYAAFAMIIAYGAWVGRMSRIQSLLLTVVGVVLYGVNRMVVIHYLYVSDVGGGMTVYLFGGVYGLAALFALLIGDKGWSCRFKCDLNGGYFPNLFGFLGTVILFVYWPRFNADHLPSGSDLQQRAIVNTYFALTSAIIVAYAMSSYVTKCCKLTIFHVQYASIAGAVIAGSVAPLITQVWGAILLGSFAGFSVVLFIKYITYFKYARPDVLGIHWTFAFSGFVSGIASAIMAAIMYKTSQPYTVSELTLLYPAVIFGNLGVGSPRSATVQGGYQMAGVIVSWGVACVGGLLAGLLVRWVGPLEDCEYFDDSAEWQICCPAQTSKCEKQAVGCHDRVTSDRSTVCDRSTTDRHSSCCERVAIPPI